MEIDAAVQVTEFLETHDALILKDSKPKDQDNSCLVKTSSHAEMNTFKGKYERTSAENYDDFLKALNIGMLLRKAATGSTPTLEISEENGVWNIKTSTTLKSMELRFKPGEEYEETTADGRQVLAVITFEDEKIVSVQKAKKEGQKSTKSIREMNGNDELIYTMTIDGLDDLMCIQKFKRV